MPSRCSSRPIISGCTQVSNSTFAPSKPICGECRAGKSCTWIGAEITAHGHAEALGDVPLHLRAQHQLRLQGRDGRLDLEVVVADQRLEAELGGGGPQLAAELAAVAAEADHVEAQLVAGDPGGGHGVGGVAEHEDAFAGQIGAVDRARVPRQPAVVLHQRGQAREPGHFFEESLGRADADRDRLGRGLAEAAVEVTRGRAGDFGIQHDVERRVAQADQVGRAGAQRGHDVDLDAEALDQGDDLLDVVTVPEAERARAEDVAAGFRRRRLGLLREGTDELVERLGRAPILLLLVGRQLQRHDRHVESHRAGEPARIVLDQLRRAGRPDQQRIGAEPLDRIARGALEQLAVSPPRSRAWNVV